MLSLRIKVKCEEDMNAEMEQNYNLWIEIKNYKKLG